MRSIADILSLIQSVSSYNDKQYILKKNEHVAGLKDVLSFIYNPYIRTGISKSKLGKALDMADNMRVDITETNCVTYMHIIRYLSEHTTGSDKDLAMVARFIKSTQELCPDAIWLAEAIVTQDLKIGVTATTLNTVYGKTFIPKVGCMLGKPLSDIRPDKVKWPCIVTEKLDGIRRLLIKENGKVRLYSRSGHEDTGLVDILEEAKLLPDNTVYDGELLAVGEFKDSIALRQATNSIANSKGDRTGLTFNVFDMLPLDEFKEGASKNTALNRKILLGATFMDETIKHLDSNRYYEFIQAFGIHRKLNYIKPVPILGVAKHLAEVEEIVAPIWQRGGEGVMLNTLDGLYEIKRSPQLLKVKHTEEYVLTVVDLEEGTGKFEGMLGALIVDYKGNLLGVGSGFCDADRLAIWEEPEKYIGRKVEVDTFGESINALGVRSLNCPIFKRFVGDE